MGARTRLDRRTILISAAIALVAALLAGAVAAWVIGGEEEDAGPTLTPVGLAPTTAYPTLDGARASVADYRGRALVVNFFSFTCVPCVTEMPALDEVSRELGNDIAVLGLAVRDTEEQARDLVERTGVTYDIGRDPSGELARGFGASALPTTVLVAPDGTIVETHLGKLTASEFRRLIDQNLR